MKKQLLAVLISTASLLHSHGWYGRCYDTHRYCRGYEVSNPRGYSKYGYRRYGGIIDGKPFYWYGTQRIWWNKEVPYVYHEQRWQKWIDVFPSLQAPKKS